MYWVYLKNTKNTLPQRCFNSLDMAKAYAKKQLSLWGPFASKNQANWQYIIDYHGRRCATFNVGSQ
jgi:hypothetical protein